jgi:3-oxoacyl-(acyl-carrier-protein) synthase
VTAAVTGLAVTTAFGRGRDALLKGLADGEPAFTPVTRFDVGRRRARVAATLPDVGPVLDEIAAAIDEACDAAGLTREQRAECLLLLSWHPDPTTVRETVRDGGSMAGGCRAAELASRCGLQGAVRTYTTACVSSSTAIADGAAMIALQGVKRLVVAAGYLVDQDYFALFDAGRAMAADGVLRAFSVGRQGLLLGDAVVAVVLEDSEAAAARGATVESTIPGWGRAGDAHHVCQPHPEGVGLARAVRSALARAEIAPSDVAYVNAHGTGTPLNDSAEAAGLHGGFGPDVAEIPVSSTKSLHGHTLEAAGLLELVVTTLALQSAQLPVNAGFLGADEDCVLDLVLAASQKPRSRYAVSLNAAFGGANTALVVAVP